MISTDLLPSADRTRLPYTTRGLLMALNLATEAALDEPRRPELVLQVAKRAINAEFYVGRAGIDTEPGAAWGIAAIRTAHEVSARFSIPDDSQNILDGLDFANTVIGLALKLDHEAAAGQTITDVMSEFRQVVELNKVAEYAAAHPEQAPQLAVLAQNQSASSATAQTFSTVAA